MQLTSQYVTIRGLSVHFCVASPADQVRHRVLLVSSPGMSVFNWRHIVPELTEAGCLCVLCDLPGYGQGECRDDAPQEPDTCARYLWGILDMLDLSEGNMLNCWHLMAHGSACCVIGAMALMHPESVSSLFMLSPMLYSPLPAFLQKLADRPTLDKIVRLWYRRNILNEQRLTRLLARIYGHPVSDNTAKRVRQSLTRLNGHEMLIRRHLIDGFRLSAGQLESLFMPCMIIWGGRDHVLGARIPKRLREQDFKSAEYHLLSTAGHYPMETNSRAVRDFLRGWIREMW